MRVTRNLDCQEEPLEINDERCYNGLLKMAWSSGIHLGIDHCGTLAMGLALCDPFPSNTMSRLIPLKELQYTVLCTALEILHELRQKHVALQLKNTRHMFRFQTTRFIRSLNRNKSKHSKSNHPPISRHVTAESKFG